jgi:pimeloyl-ACP methyl ester carboxylesterase
MIRAALNLVTVVAALSGVSASAESVPVKNIVLVHGAWADGSGWKQVYDILVQDRFNVTMVQEPETSFKDDVAATKRVLALQDGPCLLVAHSYGGAVITEAGDDPSVVSMATTYAKVIVVGPGIFFARGLGQLGAKCCPPACSCGLAFFQRLASKPMANGSLEGARANEKDGWLKSPSCLALTLLDKSYTTLPPEER